jgi:antitoxin VapB
MSLNIVTGLASADCGAKRDLTRAASYIRYIRMTTAFAKVFKSGNSQAVRLPKAFRLSSKTVKLVKTADGFSVKDEAAFARRAKAFAALAGSCPDFPEIPANAAPNARRDWE